MSDTRPSVTIALPVAALSAVWLLWSGLYKPLLLGLGALSVFLVMWLVRRADLVDRDLLRLRLWTRLPRYWVWLAREVAMSSLKITRLVLDPRMPISPTTVEIRALPTSRLGQATLGNSITLTPGTVTLDVHEGALFVHAITRDDAIALARGEMNRRVAACTER